MSQGHRAEQRDGVDQRKLLRHETTPRVLSLVGVLRPELYTYHWKCGTLPQYSTSHQVLSLVRTDYLPTRYPIPITLESR